MMKSRDRGLSQCVMQRGFNVLGRELEFERWYLPVASVMVGSLTRRWPHAIGFVVATSAYPTPCVPFRSIWPISVFSNVLMRDFKTP